ncbi:mucin-5AC-like [Actinia tenebrosa]|uniref:Mucin-5AC-like n=1 Tax=Actinia tenebrosa TaxID=6105 RepID=A0A6P8H780_ACTTE|nr:mucin-5AC-like [Actinia tenebrosa]
MSCWVTLILIGCLMFFDGGQSTITPKTAYLVRVTTSPQVNAEPATSDQVFIKLSGDKGATAFKELKRVVKSFDKGSESEFSIIATDVGKITEITVNKTATGPREAWKLKQLTIKDSKGTIYEFTCKCWISKNSGLQRTLKPNKVIPPTSTPTQGKPTTPSSSSSVSSGSSAPSASVTPTSGNTATPTNKEESTKGIAESTVVIGATSTKPTTSAGTATGPTSSQPSGSASTSSVGSTSLKSTASTSSGSTSKPSTSTSPTSAAPSGSSTSGSTSAKPSGPTSKQTSSSASSSASVSGATSKPTSATSTVSKPPTPASKPTASTSPTSVKPSGSSSVKPSGIPSSKPTSSAGPTSEKVTASIGASTAPTSMPTSTAGPTSEASTNSISQKPSAGSSKPTAPTSTSPTSAKPSGPSSSAKPSGPSTSAKPSGPTSAKPSGPSTSTKPSGPSTSAKPSGPTSAKPSGSTSAKPSGPTSAKTSGPTSAKPSGSSSAKPSGLSSAKTTTVMPPSQSTAKSSSPASAKPSGSTSAKPTSAKPSGPSSPTSSGSSTAKPSGPTTAKPFGPTTAKPSGPTTAKPSGPTTAKPSGPTSAKPSGPSRPTTSGSSPTAASPTPSTAATSGNTSSIPTTSTTPAQEHAAFMNDLLLEMNVIRLLHGAGPLLLEKNMSQAAQKEADKLFKRQTVNNETETTYGISTCNLAGSAPGKNEAKQCVSSWYQTVKDFDWPTPKVTAKSALFARLVWKPTTHVGIGVSSTNVVVYFDPPSNEMESAKDNISPVTELSDGTSQECPEGFRMSGKSCFKLNPVPLTWAKAIEHCAHHGATLASLQSQEENMFITGMVSGLQNTSEAWLGFNDRIVESRYQWVDGSVVRFHQFLQTEPTGIGENCIALKDTKNESGWEDRKCTDVLPSICRRPAEGPITYKITFLIEVGIDVQGASKKTVILPAGDKDHATMIKEKLNSTSSKQPIEFVGESTQIGPDGGTYYSVFVKIPPGSNPNVVQPLEDYLDSHNNHIYPGSKDKVFIASVTANDPANGMCYSTCITSCSNQCSPMCCSGTFIMNPSSRTQAPPYQQQTQVYIHPNSYPYSSSSSYSHPYLPNYPYSSPSAQQNSLSSTNPYMAPSTMGCVRACSKITKNDFCPPYCPKRCCRARLFRPRFFQPRLVIRPRF